MPLSRERDKLRKRVERHGSADVLSPTEALIALPRDKRIDILAEIAKHAIEKPVGAGHKIAAIKEINMMQGDYAPVRHLHGHKVQFNINLVDKGSRELPQETAIEAEYTEDD